MDEKQKLFEFRLRAELEDEQEAAQQAPQEPDQQSAIMAGLEFLGRNALKGVGALGSAIDIGTGARALRAGVGSLLGAESTGAPSVFGGRQTTGEDIIKAAGIENKPITYAAYNPALMPGEEEELGLGIGVKPSTVAEIALDPSVLVGLPGVKQVVGAGVKGAGMAAKGTGELIGAAAKGVDIATGMRIASPVVEGTATAGKATAQTVKNVASKIKDYFKPTVSRDIDKIEEIATKVGADTKDLPAVLEFGQGSSVTKLEKTLAEGLGGEDLLAKHWNTRKKIDRAINTKISGSAGGQIPDNFQAGQKIVEGHDNAVQQLFDNIDVTNKSILQNNPGMVLTNSNSKKIDSALDEIERMAKRRAGYETVDMATGEVRKVAGTQIGAQKSQAQNIIDRVNAIRGTKNKAGQYDYDSFLEAVQGMGADAHKIQSQYGIAIDTATEQNLYRKLTDIRINDIEQQLGKDVANRLRDNNKTMSEFFKKTDSIKRAVKSGKSEEKIYDQLIKSGDLRTIDSMKETMPEAFAAARAKYLDDLISTGAESHIVNGQTVDYINYGKSRIALSKNSEKLARMFSDSPEILKDIEDFTMLGQRMGAPVMSTSGTGGSIAVREGVKDVAKEAALKAQLDLLKKKARRNFGESLTASERMARGIPEPTGIQKLYSSATKPGKSIYKGTRQTTAVGLQKISGEKE